MYIYTTCFIHIYIYIFIYTCIYSACTKHVYNPGKTSYWLGDIRVSPIPKTPKPSSPRPKIQDLKPNTQHPQASSPKPQIQDLKPDAQNPKTNSLKPKLPKPKTLKALQARIFAASAVRISPQGSLNPSFRGSRFKAV